MKSYTVEEMAGDTPVSHYTVIAETPWEAATVATRRAVQARRDEPQWVRVINEKDRAVYRYAFK